MDILVITQYFYPETFRVNDLCQELVRRGHKVTVLTGYPQYPQGKIYDGYGFHTDYATDWNGVQIERIKVHPRGKTPFGMLRNCYDFVAKGKSWVKKCTKQFDAVYVFEVSPVTVGLPAVAYREKFGVPMLFNVQDLWPENVEVVLGIHNPVVLGMINRIVDKIYTASDIILCSSRSFVDNIRSKRGVPEKKLVYWPQFCMDPINHAMEKPAVCDADTFNLVFAGNLGTAQGLDLLIDAAARLKDRGVRFILVGDGRSRKTLQAKAETLGLKDTVIFVGKVSETEANAYIHYADCAYLSFQDNPLFDMTIPAKLQSYLACGTPILAAAGGESADLIQEAKCGVVVRRNVEELTDGILSLKELGRQGLSCFRKNGRKYYEEHFTMKRIVDQLEQLIETTISNDLISRRE